VDWIVVHDPEKVKKIAALTIEWMNTLAGSNHPMSGYIPVLLEAWESGRDVVCRGAPHLLVATIPEGNTIAQTDARRTQSRYQSDTGSILALFA
jgi:hypothetical protein